MGAEPWSYFVAYDTDVQRALDRLREREFRHGRFRYAEEQPSSISEALEIADADGTASILDMDRVADEPDFGVVAPLSNDELIEFFGTTEPTRPQVESSEDVFEILDRGQGRYAVVYADGQPSELYFAGYSYD